MAEAQALGLDVVGHRPLGVSAVEAAAVGQKSIEHARVSFTRPFPEAPRCEKRPPKTSGRSRGAASSTSMTRPCVQRPFVGDTIEVDSDGDGTADFRIIVQGDAVVPTDLVF